MTQREPPGHQLYGADRCSKEEEGTPVQEVGAGAGLGVGRGNWGQLARPVVICFVVCGTRTRDASGLIVLSPDTHPSVSPVFVCHQYLSISVSDLP